jgi:hypothetical protein
LDGLTLRLLDVVWMWDQQAYNRHTQTFGKWKAVVAMAVEAEPWIFFRINTKAETRASARLGSVHLSLAEHPFLDHESFLYCGGPPVLVTAADLAAAMAPQQRADRRGIVGRIAPACVPDIRAYVTASAELTEEQRARILAALGG